MFWSYFDEVSIRENKDSLKVYFYGPQYFRTTNDVTFEQDVVVEIEKFVPLQMDKKLGQLLESFGAALEKGSKAVVIFNFLLNMVLSGAL